MAAFAKEPGGGISEGSNQHPALLGREDCTPVAWYRSLYAPRAGGAYESPSDGGNCWPHSAARRLRGRSRRACSRRARCGGLASSHTNS